ncbi:unnamed protein product [Coffea canephora]|uniref:DH200=94 genomic scaffold, scaffold_428 n=1 Tax=Coffea canephora TaxID=49390 RepID=A0A068VER9_COFCA|nr:unnamed protein product [Coffea canephora]
MGSKDTLVTQERTISNRKEVPKKDQNQNETHHLCSAQTPAIIIYIIVCPTSTTKRICIWDFVEEEGGREGPAGKSCSCSTVDWVTHKSQLLRVSVLALWWLASMKLSQSHCWRELWTLSKSTRSKKKVSM